MKQLSLVEFLLKSAFPRVWWVTLHAALVESFTASFVAQIICGLLNFSQTLFGSHEARTRETTFDSGRTSVLIPKTNRFCFSIWNEYTPISPSSRQNQMNSVCTNVFKTCLCNSWLCIWDERNLSWRYFSQPCPCFCMIITAADWRTSSKTDCIW